MNRLISVCESDYAGCVGYVVFACVIREKNLIEMRFLPLFCGIRYFHCLTFSRDNEFTFKTQVRYVFFCRNAEDSLTLNKIFLVLLSILLFEFVLWLKCYCNILY